MDGFFFYGLLPVDLRRGKIGRGFLGESGTAFYEAPKNEKNFTTLLEMINASEVREEEEDFQSPVDEMFHRLEEKDPALSIGIIRAPVYNYR